MLVAAGWCQVYFKKVDGLVRPGCVYLHMAEVEDVIEAEHELVRPHLNVFAPDNILYHMMQAVFGKTAEHTLTVEQYMISLSQLKFRI